MKFTKFIKPELEQIKENANFTEEEERIFSLLCRGFSQKKIFKNNFSPRAPEKIVIFLYPPRGWRFWGQDSIFTDSQKRVTNVQLSATFRK